MSTLIAFGADVQAMAWDFERGVKNTPLHRVANIKFHDAFEALVGNSKHDFNARDKLGSTPLMSLMECWSGMHSDEYLMIRFRWLLGHGASCLPVNAEGLRVSDMHRSQVSPFKDLIARRVRDENWGKHKGVVIARQVLCKRLRSTSPDFLAGHDELTRLVKKVAGLHIEGIFRKIATFL